MAKASKARVAPLWRATWTPVLEGWTAKQIRQNLWRFDPADGFDDVMQEAKLLFFTLSKKYPIVKDTAHFVALYKTSLRRSMIDKGRAKGRRVIPDLSVDDLTDDMQPTATNDAYLSLILQELPDELKVVLGGLTTGRVRLKLDKSTRNIRYRENANMRLKRRFSIAAIDPVGDLRNYLSNA